MSQLTLSQLLSELGGGAQVTGFFLVLARVSPLFVLAYLFDIPAVMVPVLVKAWQRGEVRRALASMPGFLVLRWARRARPARPH